MNNTGGVSGMAIVIQHFSPEIAIGPLMLIINILFLITGYALIGRNFGSKTVYSSLMLSSMVWLLDKIYPINSLLPKKPCLNFLKLFLRNRFHTQNILGPALETYPTAASVSEFAS